jgi:hypothetical protein
MQTIERKNDLTFNKWDKVGKSLDVVITDEAVLGKQNQFGGEDNYFRGVISGTDDKVQVNMPHDLLKKFELVQDAVVLGQTRFVITYTGSKPMKGKAPLKLFDVQVEGLAGESASAPGPQADEDIPF